MPPYLFAAVLALSAAMLSFQILQVAVLGLQLFPEGAFLVVALSMLGLGSGGSLAALLLRRGKTIPPTAVMWWCAVAFSIAVVATMAATSRTHGLVGLILFNALPYVFIGLFLAVAFATWPERANQIYFYDLVGAGLGCGAIVALLNLLGDAGLATLVLAFLGASAAVLIATGFRPQALLASAGLVAILAVITPWHDALFPFEPEPGKFYGMLLLRGEGGGRVERQKWNYLGRLDSLVPGPAVADFEFTRQVKELRDGGSELRFLFSNGYNWTYTVDFKGDDQQRQVFLRRWVQNAPYLFTRNPEVLNLGSGGGVDVYLATQHGARSAIGVEINPLMIEAATQWYPHSWDDLWRRPEVSVVEMDARTFVNTTDRRFDVITLNAIDTGAAQASLLSANFLYTTEAFREYLRLLRPGGVVFLTRPREQLLRALTAAVAALGARGERDPARHFVVFGEGELLSAGIYTDALTRAQVAAARERVAAGELGGALQYAPDTSLPSNLFTDYFAALAAGDETGFLARSPRNFEATTDDRPFFYDFDRDFRRGAAGSLLRTILALVMICGLFVLYAPLFALPLPGRGRLVAGNLAYFGSIGVGFMLAEVCLITKLALILGHPAYSVTVTLMSMLVFSGLGSMVSGRAIDRGYRPISLALLLIALSLGAYSFGVDLLAYSHFERLGARVLLVVAFLAPVSIFLGIPLPSKLRTLRATRQSLVPWAWAVNAFASVAGSVLALMLAMSLGFRAVLLLAAGCYLLALVAHLATPSAPLR